MHLLLAAELIYDIECANRFLRGQVQGARPIQLCFLGSGWLHCFTVLQPSPTLWGCLFSPGRGVPHLQEEQLGSTHRLPGNVQCSYQVREYKFKHLCAVTVLLY